MYSYEDRVRAVELYIKLGKRVHATIRQLGLPDQECLAGATNTSNASNYLWAVRSERRSSLSLPTPGFWPLLRQVGSAASYTAPGHDPGER